jgi:hypothetical protein
MWRMGLRVTHIHTQLVTKSLKQLMWRMGLRVTRAQVHTLA